MKHFYRYLLFVTLTIMSITVRTQPYPVIGSGGTQVTPGGAWSKNMELICPLSLPFNGHEMFQFSKIKYGSSLGSTGYYIVTTDRDDPSEIRLVDVTNPRSINADAIKIRVVVGTGNANLSAIEVWTDNSTGNTFSEHTFAVVYCTDVVVNSSPEIRASYLIFDLSEALTCGATTITVSDPKTRVVSGTGLISTYEKSVYLGYTKKDQTFMIYENGTSAGPHTTWVDNQLGAFLVSPLAICYPNHSQVADGPKSYIGMYDLRKITTNGNANRTSTSFIQLKKVGKNLGSEDYDAADDADIEPIVLTTPSSFGSLEQCNHEATSEYVDDDKIRVYTASYCADGGITIQNVDYSDPGNVTYDGLQYWLFSSDRRSPSAQTSSGWTYNNPHTVTPATINGTKYIITCNELASPYYDHGQGIDINLTNPSGTWQGAGQRVRYDGTNENDKYLGNYLRVWETQTTNGFSEIKGTGTGLGPLCSYDPIEQDPSSVTLYNGAALSNSSIAAISATAADNLSSSNAVGPNTIHRVRAVSGATDVFIAAYAQGVRVLDLKDLSTSNPIVKEKAFFDYIPTLNYAKNSEYFYLNGNSSDSYSDFKDFFLPSLQSYFQGTWDIRADIERTGISGGLPSDEKFVYGMGLGEGYMSGSGETLPRNWLSDGGFMVLRYFDDKIGGTISGYTGTTAWNNRSYREVNLQGTFEVSRDATVASGATVNLLKSTQLNPDGSPGECLIIDGTVNVQTLATGFTSTIADGRGVIDVPVLVRSGGKLIVNEGAVIDFLKPVTVNDAGELRIKAGAKVAFGANENTCNGKLIVEGTSTNRAKVSAKRGSPDRSIIIGNASILMKGSGTGANTTLKVHYADVENVCIDARNIKASYPMLWESNFSSHTSAKSDALVSYTRSAFMFWDVNRVVVQNCTFKDRDQNSTYSFNGLFLSNTYWARVLNSTFEYLNTGLYLDGGGNLILRDNNFNNGNQGIVASNGLPLLCANDFAGVDLGYNGANTMGSYLFDNDFEDGEVGALVQLGPNHYFRGNSFDEFATGLYGSGTWLELRDAPDPNSGTWYKYGRNSFTVSAGQLGGRATNDIELVVSGLSIHCGYNYFSQNSGKHVLNDINNATLNVGFNEWNDLNSTFNVRTNMTPVGAPLNTSQTSTAVCGNVEMTVPCPISNCAQEVLSFLQFDGDSLVIDDSVWHWKYDSVWGWQASPSASVACRLQYLQGAFTLVSMRDSGYYYAVALDEFNDIYANTSDSAVLRSRALFLKGQVYERMDSISAALSTYSTLVSNFASSVDSIPAAWRIQYLNAMLDTTLYRDTLLQAYHARVLSDSKRITYHQYVAPKIAAPSGNAVRTEGLSLEQNVPNPWSGETEIAFTLPNSGIVRLAIMDVLGNEFAVLVDGEQKAGRNRVHYKAPELSDGIYFYRLQFGNDIITQKMTKSK